MMSALPAQRIIRALTAGPLLCSLATLACVAYALHAGKTVSWDVLHYHLYAGFSALHDRFDKDFMAAGPQSYLNPYALVPFYAMEAANWPATVQTVVFAAVHSLNLWLVYALSRLMLPRAASTASVLVLLVAWLLTLANPVFWSEVGTTYTDVTTALPVLVSCLALCLGVSRLSLGLVIWSGVAVGLAMALKLSNVVYVIAIGCGWLLIAGSWRLRVMRSAFFGAGAVLGLLVGGGLWGWRLWQAFGNPVFPNFNTIFKSPDYSLAGGGVSTRFIPESIWDALTMPFRMALPESMVYVENTQPELRFAAFMLIVLVGVALWSWRRLHVRGREVAVHTECPAPRGLQVTRVMTGVVLVAWTLWMASSGNGRYLLPLSLLIGAVWTALWWHTTQGGRWFWYVVVALLGVQGVQLLYGTDGRWDKQASWGHRWVDVDVPNELKTSPALLLSTGMGSNTVVLPWLHPDSGMVTIGGQVPLSPGMPGHARVEALLKRHGKHVRILTATTDTVRQGQDVAGMIPPATHHAASRWGYRINPADCIVITVHVASNEVWLRRMFAAVGAVMTRQPVRTEAALDHYELLACALVADPQERQRHVQATAAVEAVLDQLEDLCPATFRPARVVTERQGPSGWTRYYGITDVTASVRAGRVLYSDSRSASLMPRNVNLGNLADWQQGIGPALPCH